jgi:D-alanyl-D-alanine carboxypeptidase
MKKIVHLILFVFCLISCTLICRALTDQSALFTTEQMAPLKKDLRQIKANCSSMCALFPENLLNEARMDPYLFYIVDKDNSLPSNYTPTDLVGEGKAKVRQETFDAFEKMAQAAQKEDINLWILSGFRSFQRQTEIYNRSLANRGPEHTDKFIARPGQSQHQLGTAVDINSVENSFVNTKEYAWLKENAETFGFSLSFPEGQQEKTGYAFEPWHYRYITPLGATLQKIYFHDSQVDFLNTLNACLEENCYNM